jgi:hypothetical protein
METSEAHRSEMSQKRRTERREYVDEYIESTQNDMDHGTHALYTSSNEVSNLETSQEEKGHDDARIVLPLREVRATSAKPLLNSCVVSVLSACEAPSDTEGLERAGTASAGRRGARSSSGARCGRGRGAPSARRFHEVRGTRTRAPARESVLPSTHKERAATRSAGAGGRARARTSRARARSRGGAMWVGTRSVIQAREQDAHG